MRLPDFLLHFRERHRQGIKRGQPKNLSRPLPHCIVAKQLNKYSIYVFGKIVQAFFNSFSLPKAWSQRLYEAVDIFTHTESLRLGKLLQLCLCRSFYCQADGYKRTFRRRLASSSLPRASPCFLCFFHNIVIFVSEIPAGKEVPPSSPFGQR